MYEKKLSKLFRTIGKPLENEILLEIEPIFIKVWTSKDFILVKEFYNLEIKEIKEESYL